MTRRAIVEAVEAVEAVGAVAARNGRAHAGGRVVVAPYLSEEVARNTPLLTAPATPAGKVCPRDVRGALARRWVQIRVSGATHLAKHTRGLVARHLCEVGLDARTPRGLAEVVGQAFEVDLTPPARVGQAWVLDASPRTGGEA